MRGAKVVVSLLGATSLERVERAFPDAEVVRVMPNVGVEVRQGSALRGGTRDTRGYGSLLEGLGHVVELADAQFDAATAVMGCAPAYVALAVEAIADAGAADGLDEELARELVVETTAGTAELLRAGTLPTCARRWRRPAAAPRRGWRRWTARVPARRSRRRCGPRWRGCGG